MDDSSKISEKFGEQVNKAVSRNNSLKNLIVNSEGNGKEAVLKKNKNYTYYEKALTYRGIPFLIGVTIAPKRELYVLFNQELITSKFNKNSQNQNFSKQRSVDGEEWFALADPLNTEFFKDGTEDARKEMILEEILNAVRDGLDQI